MPPERAGPPSPRSYAALSAIYGLTKALLAGAETSESLRLVARYARELVGADVATVAVPDDDGDTLVLQVADGPGTTAWAGSRFPRAGTVPGEVLATGEAIVLEDASNDGRAARTLMSGDIGPALFVALVTDAAPFGTLSVARATGSPPFSAADLEMVRSFTLQASVAFEQDRARRQHQRLTLLEAQERLARDLHDTVIQRLFAIGLSLQATGRLVPDAQAQARLAAAVNDLDATVRHIRTVIFDIETPRTGRDSGLRGKVLHLLQRVAPALGFEPQVTFAGLVDTSVPDALADEVLATLREALSNTTRHAHASHVSIELTVSGPDVVVRVRDDGIGVTADRVESTGGHGLHNMRARAERLGGHFAISGGADGGTVVQWQAPLSGS